MEVSPAILEFKGPFTKTSTEKLLLTNNSNETLAFKVKTTAPKLYCVRPNASIIQPGDSLEVAIILQGLREEPSPDYKCKDKFLLVTLPCPYEGAETRVAELWPQLESEFKSTSKKIKVNYLLSGASAPVSGHSAPVASSQSKAATTSSSTNPIAPVAAAGAAGIASSASNTKDVLDSTFTTIDEPSVAAPVSAPVVEKETVQSEPVSVSTSTEEKVVPASKGGIPLPFALVIAILAFLIGKYFL